MKTSSKPTVFWAEMGNNIMPLNPQKLNKRISSKREKREREIILKKFSLGGFHDVGTVNRNDVIHSHRI